MPSFFAGIEIGGTKLQLVRGTAQGQILQRARFLVDPKAGAPGIQTQILAGLAALSSSIELDSIGVGFGGPVDHRSGLICKSHQIDGWTNFPFADWLQGETGARVTVDNDANVAALGEALHGAGKGVRSPVFYVTLGSGVGGGLVQDGRIYHGLIPGESEIGHLRLNKSGLLVEQSCSGWAVDKKVREAIGRYPECALAHARNRSPGGEAKLLAAALDQNDSVARRILEETADDLAFALSHVMHLFHPGLVVLGGGLSLLGEPLRKEVSERLPAYVMKAFLPLPPVRLAELKEDAVPAGALALAASSDSSLGATSSAVMKPA